MTKATKISTERSEAREALAAANAESATVAQTSAAARDAIARANKHVDDVRAALDAAREKTTKAKEARTALIVSAAQSGETLTQDTVSRDARREVNEAEDELEAATAALEAIREAVDPDAGVRSASVRQRQCIDAILLGEVKRQMQEAENLAKPLAEKIAVLRMFASTLDYIPNVDVVQSINRFQRQFILPDHIVNQNCTESAAWRAAAEALKTNADAELPK
jgi:DNA repair exonuclease SbcCD ATPase subunit